jgi:hypothetical protein
MLLTATKSPKTHASAEDTWWDDDWPYRVPVNIDGPGVVALNLDFSQLFNNLGLRGALLDLGSIRVVPYTYGTPGNALPYDETYSQLIIDGDSLGEDLENYWTVDLSTSLTIDDSRYTQGSGAVKAHTEITETSNAETGFSFQFNGSELANWSEYETLIYDVWPEVNQDALNQAPDLYFFELDGDLNCPVDHIISPGMAINRWNTASVSLKPFGSCQTTNLFDLDALRFFVRLNRPWAENGDYDPGDVLDLWLDNFRLVDQDGDGEIRWFAAENVDKYYIYFDTLNHEGHPHPELTSFTQGALITNIGEPEAGGYFHKIAGVSNNTLSIWNAPPTEKILPSYQVPVTTRPVVIHAARGEFEPIQLVVNSSMNQTLPVSVGNLRHRNGYSIISASKIDLFRVDYLEISRLSDQYGRLGLWPDPLYPINHGQSINFRADFNQAIWVRIEVPTVAQPGIYDGRIFIGGIAVPITLRVLFLTLPEEPLLDSKFGFDLNGVLDTYHATSSPCENQMLDAIAQTFRDYRLVPFDPVNSSFPEDLYTLSSYEIIKAQTAQFFYNREAWWEFNPADTPPFANPAVIDRPGVDARILPWLAWLDRIDGLYYPDTTDWDDNPWLTPMDEFASNGNGFLFYPPKDDTLGFDPCVPESNRLVPSIRLELLREGMEDYAYLWLLNEGNPLIFTDNQSDLIARESIQSETKFSHIPIAIDDLKAKIILKLEMNIFFPLIFN